MRAEHCSLGGHDYEFASNYGITSTPAQEWLYVVGDDKGQRASCPDMGHGRRIVSIEEHLYRPLAKKAKLTRAEMIAVVLYTGPMSVVYNGILARFPRELYDVFAKSDNRFSTTICVLASAVLKLSRSKAIPAGTVLYLGLRGRTRISSLFECSDFVNFGFTSMSADKTTVAQHSRDKEGQLRATIMVCQDTDSCAAVSDFSQYPNEKEFVFVPSSLFKRQRRQQLEVVEGGAVHNLEHIRVHANAYTKTVEQMCAEKKVSHLNAFRSLIKDTASWMRAYVEEGGRAQARAATDTSFQCFDISAFISETIDQLQEILQLDERASNYDYAHDLKYKAIVSRMVSSQEWAKQKLLLWLQNEEMILQDLSSTPLKSAHRQWLSFLKQRYSVAARGSDQRKGNAVKILQCKGLMVTYDVLTEEADGEPLIYAAVASGWALDDLQACTSCKDAALLLLTPALLQCVIDAGANVDAENQR